MYEKIIWSFAIKITVIVCALFGCYIGAYVYPKMTSHDVVWTYPYESDILMRNISFYTRLAFYYISSIPCFAVLILVWKVSGAVVKNKLLTHRVAYLVEMSSKILYIVLLSYIAANIVFQLVGWGWDFIFGVYYVISGIGLLIAMFLHVLSHYLYKAAFLKDEAEGIV